MEMLNSMGDTDWLMDPVGQKVKVSNSNLPGVCWDLLNRQRDCPSNRILERQSKKGVTVNGIECRWKI